MDDIRTWFNGARKYDDGVKLYLKHGTDAVLARLFTAEGYSPFKLQKLTSALDDLLANSKQSPKRPAKSAQVAPAKNPDPLPDQPAPEKKWRTDRDPIEESLYRKWKPVFAEMMSLMARVGDVARAGLKDPDKQLEAGRMALRILDLDDECDTLYYNRDYYLQHTKLPIEQKPVEISLDYLLWPKRLANHKRYVRQFKNDLAKDPSNVDKAELLQKHEWAVAEYERLLKMRNAI